MAYNSNVFAGLHSASRREFFFAQEAVQLATMTNGVESSAPQVASFTYDDTCFGEISDGVWYRLATCSGMCAQLMFFPFAPGYSGTPCTLQALTASMDGFGTLDIGFDALSNSSDRLVLLSSQLPMPYSGQFLFLLRPHSIPNLWDGRDNTNEALRTLWLPGEIGAVTYHYTVSAQDIRVYFDWQTQGWVVPG